MCHSHIRDCNCLDLCIVITVYTICHSQIRDCSCLDLCMIIQSTQSVTVTSEIAAVSISALQYSLHNVSQSDQRLQLSRSLHYNTVYTICHSQIRDCSCLDLCIVITVYTMCHSQIRDCSCLDLCITIQSTQCVTVRSERCQLQTVSFAGHKLDMGLTCGRSPAGGEDPVGPVSDRGGRNEGLSLLWPHPLIGSLWAATWRSKLRPLWLARRT